MQEIECISCIHHIILFLCSKRSQIKFYTYLIIKIHNKRELQSIAINHLANYKDFMKIYRKCTSEPYSFLTIDTTLPVSDPLRFRKNLLLSYKNDIN